MTLVSIIVRTKNEERWIASCLASIKEQTVRDFEVILVDSDSTDKTLQRAVSVMPDVKIVRITEFYPGRALNTGIRESSGQYLAFLSSHCIPKQYDWLERLLRNFDDDPKLAGVYGRQIPMHFTNLHDKRDMIVTFGLDRRVQRKDPFFHNANSMIPRTLWDRFPFDEQTTNIEDRLWAKQVLAEGYHLVYEPEAPVYHHHGIYQTRNEHRVRNVIRIMGSEAEFSLTDISNPFYHSKLNIAVIIPVREEPEMDEAMQDHLLKCAIEAARESGLVSQVIVSTDSDRIHRVAESLGAHIPFLRPNHLSGSGVPVADVLRHTLEWYENQGEFFDYIVTLEITHPFRPPGLVQSCIENALETGLDSVIAGVAEFRPCWWLDGEEYQRVDDYIHNRTERQPIQVGLPALCTVVTPALLREGKRLGDRVGIVETTDPLARIEVRTATDYTKLERLFRLPRPKDDMPGCR
jgi:rhamnosyltransferase